MDSLVTAWSGKLASFWYQTITSAQELSSWSRSLESDATVRADYALTTTTTTRKQFDIGPANPLSFRPSPFHPPFLPFLPFPPFLSPPQVA